MDDLWFKNLVYFRGGRLYSDNKVCVYLQMQFFPTFLQSKYTQLYNNLPILNVGYEMILRRHGHTNKYTLQIPHKILP